MNVDDSLSESISSIVLPLILVMPNAVTSITRLASDMSMPKAPWLATMTSESLWKLIPIVLGFGVGKTSVVSILEFGLIDGNVSMS